jgi:histidine phosphotransferase ChpT
MRADIASLVGSRICHDLSSPIGAISNGVELIGMTQSTDGAEMTLINDSVDNANARIRFFRVAYGAAGTDQTMSKADILSILTAIARGGRMNYYWQIETPQSRQDVRVAFLLIQCFENALPRGGDITVSQVNGAWSLIASGPQLRWEEDLWDSLTNDFALVSHTPAQVQFALLPEALSDTGRKLEISRVENQISTTLR